MSTGSMKQMAATVRVIIRIVEDEAKKRPVLRER
jgi:hypothetical protein